MDRDTIYGKDTGHELMRRQQCEGASLTYRLTAKHGFGCKGTIVTRHA